MHIIVVGAGAIGSLYGAKLARDNEVTLIARPAHASAINAHGLTIEGLEPQTVHVPAATRVERIEPDALILVTTKVPATAAALAPIAALVRDDTTVVSLQNGLGSETLVRDALGGRGVVLRGITQFGAIFERPGAIRYMVAGYTILEQHERSPKLAQTMNAAGLDSRISPDIAADVWQKLIFNCVVNPITAMIGCEVGGITNPGLDPLKHLVISECLGVAAAEGISFEIDFLARINEVYAGSQNIVSMLQDLRHRRPTEIDYLNGAIVRLAPKHGIETPVNASLTNIIKAME
ncbi:MAG TPA: 2-dehydropantoate 2-reductase [Chthoniobacterales bacterium]|nr:2-dehydropantoate 2-reductase [Chthoniobacterales bacterium]